MPQEFCHLLLPLLLLQIPLFSLAFPALPQPDPASVQPFRPNPISPAATIPAFPEQSDLSGCPLTLPDDLFHSISSACSPKPTNPHNPSYNHHLNRFRCCPVLAAWLYSAYSATALGRATRTAGAASTKTTAQYYDLPLLPDDSETCVENLEKALSGRGIALTKPNQTCDVVYCYCGVRLHPLSCPEAFSVSSGGRLVGNQNVDMLEKNCLNENGNGMFSSLDSCSKCLKSLYKLNEQRGSNTSTSDRKSKMHNRDCQLMGLTWLLSKNRTAYIPTVASVIRALMMTADGSDLPQSCSDGMPLAVDSAQLDDQSSSTTLSVAIPLVLALTTLPLFFRYHLH